ncbi:MAG: hypothetical protein CME64_13735 [Halobacteriovoraceae bacterium]|nr:hypothetical protein [Halobacteriovoraceae bacterium]|tara:strand:- start:45785 stop:46741 length:957 start_codon:yes stop_codon:yes gene_type:complete
MSTLNKVQKLIQGSHDEVLMCKKWNVFYSSQLYRDANDKLWPTTHRYYFEGNPSFLCEYKNFADMERFPIIMLRDSLVTLAAFFLTNTIPPKKFKTIFLIPKRWSHIVPRSWRDNVASFEIIRPQAENPETVLAFGHFNDYSFWKDSPKKTFERVKSILPENSKKIFYVPMRDRSVFSHIDESPSYAECMRIIFQNFGSDIELVTDNNKILNVKLSSKDAYCDLTPDNLLCSDSYLHHWFGTKNIGELGGKKVEQTNNDLVYPLSLYHSICISKLQFDEQAFASLFYKTKVQKIPTDEANPGFHMFLKDLVKAGDLKI